MRANRGRAAYGPPVRTYTEEITGKMEAAPLPPAGLSYYKMRSGWRPVFSLYLQAGLARAAALGWIIAGNVQARPSVSVTET